MGTGGAWTAAVAALVRPDGHGADDRRSRRVRRHPMLGQRPSTLYDRPSAELHALGLNRDEARSFLALPARLVVYSADERAEWLGRRPPSGYPFFGSIRQYWAGYNAICEVTSREHAFGVGDHIALAAAGAAFSAEHALTGLWEKTIGRATEWLSKASSSWPTAPPTPEDAFAVRTAPIRRVHPQIPWYDFPFGDRLITLWNGSPMLGPNVIRKWDRRILLTAEYGLKAFAALIARQVASPAGRRPGVDSRLCLNRPRIGRRVR